MFDKLEDLVDRLDTLNNQLTDPDIVSDQNKFRKLMKEQSELTPIVEKYKEYKDNYEYMYELSAYLLSFSDTVQYLYNESSREEATR